MNLTEHRSAVAELKTKIEARQSRIDELAAVTGDDLTDDLRSEFATLAEEQDAALADALVRAGELAKAEKRAADLDALRKVDTTAIAGGGLQVIRQVDPAAVNPLQASRMEVRDAALKTVELSRSLSDDNKGHLETLSGRHTDNFDGDYVTRRTLLTENDAYRSAFAKRMVRGATAALSAEENQAVADFQEFESRAASTTSASGGYGVPVFIDPTIVLTSGAADAPVLSICRVETITVNTWKGVKSTGLTWSWDAEASAVSDDAPTLAQPSVNAYMARGFVPYSIEIGQDYPGFESEMAKLLAQGYVDLWAASSVVGSGSSQPRGIFTALDANTNDEVASTTDGAFGAEDIFAVWNALPERYRSRASWLMSVSHESKVRAFSTSSQGSYFTVDMSAGGISRLNGRPVYITDYAPTFSSTTGAANRLVVGDFSNFLVVQRAGMSVEQIPMLFDTTSNLPTGQRGWFAWARSGSDSINDLGFRLLQNT